MSFSTPSPEVHAASGDGGSGGGGGDFDKRKSQGRRTDADARFSLKRFPSILLSQMSFSAGRHLHVKSFNLRLPVLH